MCLNPLSFHWRSIYTQYALLRNCFTFWLSVLVKSQEVLKSHSIVIQKCCRLDDETSWKVPWALDDFSDWKFILTSQCKLLKILPDDNGNIWSDYWLFSYWSKNERKHEMKKQIYGSKKLKILIRSNHRVLRRGNFWARIVIH